ncbi:MAG: orotate phosphoribosyltransferase [Patescibacteria group bacterium]
MKKSLIKVVARPEILLIGPVKSPVSQVIYPLYVAVKKIYSNPDSLKILGREIGKLVKKIGGKKIIGCETSGLVLAAAASIEVNLPMCYVRKNKAVFPRYTVEGIVKKGERVVLVDDAIVKGNTKLTFIKHIKDQGGVVAGIVTMLDVPKFKNSEARKKLKKMGIACHSLFTWLEWWQAFHKAGLMSDAMAAIAYDAEDDIMKWQGKNKEARIRWQWFNKVKREQHNRFI